MEPESFAAKNKVNIGVMGHVDAGKTSLCATLSSILSTAALDKNPQSQERGITLDLQFSALETEKFLLTFTDCPGHASLFRTIIGGAQIIDMVLLVIDATKGMQTQTAEGVVVAGITVDRMLVVLNKVDMFPAEERETRIKKLQAILNKSFDKTNFKNVKMVPFSNKEPEKYKQSLIDALELEGAEIVKQKAEEKNDASKDNLLILTDHCFAIKGKGTVITGTVIKGEVKVNQDIFIPQLGLTKKVKSLQMFKKNVPSAKKGDRVGILLTQFDADSMERGIICGGANQVPLISSAIVGLTKVPFYKQKIDSKAKFHFTVGHSTVMGSCRFFCSENPDHLNDAFSIQSEYLYLPSWEAQPTCFAFVTFESPLYIPIDSILIASKLDKENAQTCRLGFHGKIISAINPNETALLKVYTKKQKEGKIERVVTPNEVIAKDLFKKETDMTLFTKLNVYLPNGEKGTIAGTFGKSGKFKVFFPGGTSYSNEELVNMTITLPMKRFVFDKSKKIQQ